VAYKAPQGSVRRPWRQARRLLEAPRNRRPDWPVQVMFPEVIVHRLDLLTSSPGGIVSPIDPSIVVGCSFYELRNQRPIEEEIVTAEVEHGFAIGEVALKIGQSSTWGTVNSKAAVRGIVVFLPAARVGIFGPGAGCPRRRSGRKESASKRPAAIRAAPE